MVQEYEYDVLPYLYKIPGQLRSDSAVEEAIVAPLREKAQAISAITSARAGGWEVVSHNLLIHADRLIISFLMRRPKKAAMT